MTIDLDLIKLIRRAILKCRVEDYSACSARKILQLLDEAGYEIKRKDPNV